MVLWHNNDVLERVASQLGCVDLLRFAVATRCAVTPHLAAARRLQKRALVPHNLLLTPVVLAACDTFAETLPLWWSLCLDDEQDTTAPSPNHSARHHMQLLELVQRLASKRQYVEWLSDHRGRCASGSPPSSLLSPVAVLGLVGEVKRQREEDSHGDLPRRISLSTVAVLIDESGDVILLDHQLRTDREGDLEHRARVVIGRDPEEVARRLSVPEERMPLLASLMRSGSTATVIDQQPLSQPPQQQPQPWVSLMLSESIENSVLDWIGAELKERRAAGRPG